MPILKAPDLYWSLLEDVKTTTPDGSGDNKFQVFYSGGGTKREHAQMQWLFQGAMMHMTLQAAASIDHAKRAHYQLAVPGTDHRVYSPIGFYMDEADFDYFTQSSYIPTFFADDMWLQKIVSDFIGWTLTKDQALMLMHLDLIHDNYEFKDMPTQFGYCAQHFGLFLPMPNETIPVLQKPPEAIQPSLRLVH